MVTKKKFNKIIISASSFMTIESFLLPFINKLSNNFEVFVFTNLKNIKKDKIINFEKKYNFKFVHIPIRRNISLFYDLITLIKVILLLMQLKPKVSLSLTPKAGLFISISSFINMVPFRLHIFNGQIWYNKKSFKKNFLKFFDKLTFNLSNKILCESVSQKNFLVKEGFVKKNIEILGYGSLMGVDTNIFKSSFDNRKKLRNKFNIKNTDKVCMYVGRINDDKGINLIMKASEHFEKNKNIFFFLIGENEMDTLKFFNMINNKKNIIYLSHQNNIHHLLNIADIVTLPSLREGFGISIIEAASTEKVVLISNIDGLKDTTINNQTGLYFNPNDQKDFIKKLSFLFKNQDLVKKMGKNARKNVLKKYKKENVINLYTQYIYSLCNFT